MTSVAAVLAAAMNSALTSSDTPRAERMQSTSVMLGVTFPVSILESLDRDMAAPRATALASHPEDSRSSRSAAPRPDLFTRRASPTSRRTAQPEP